MYSGNNKTALTSQAQIAEALLALMDEEPYQDISVSAICKQAGVSRQTFYSLFQSKDNVMTFTLLHDCEYSPGSGAGACTWDLRHFSEEFSAYIIRHAVLLRRLSDRNLMPLLENVLRKNMTCCPELLSHIRVDMRPYAVRFLAAGITGIAEAYVRNGAAEDAASLTKIIGLLLSGKFLYE